MFGLRRFAIERPVIFWSFVLGSIEKNQCYMDRQMTLILHGYRLHATCDSIDGYNGFLSINHTSGESHKPIHPDNQLHHPSQTIHTTRCNAPLERRVPSRFLIITLAQSPAWLPSPTSSASQNPSFPLCTDQPGAGRPVLVFTVPKVRREYFGFKGVEALPITYPLPNRARNPPSGYEDA
ncbi:hypothetical protein [Absidia glauca]|uniref:Uncharacterized protein n=1 Tax=Absidia glauca TaxID=4829 RepID=A0A168RRZ3_ABSGL|nr:hypothetical protein [Absidia glauca]